MSIFAFFLLCSFLGYCFLTEGFRQGVSELFRALIFVWLLNTFFLQIYQVPTGSMIPTILEGDVVVVSKLHYGPKTPQIPLHIPFTESTFLGKKSYSALIKLPIFRFWGISDVKRGDIIVFNTPHEQDRPIGMRQLYTKRCIGLPGDRVALRNGHYFINGIKEAHDEKRRLKFTIKASKALPDLFLDDYIQEHRLIGPNTYSGYGIRCKMKELAQCAFITHIGYAPELTATNEMAEVLVPYKGMKVTLNMANCLSYQKTIADHEGNREVCLKGGKLLINGVAQSHYTFKQDYYFASGDNRHNSYDSRAWGFVPKNHLVGKALGILASGKNPKRHLMLNLLTFQVRSNRFFRRMAN